MSHEAHEKLPLHSLIEDDAVDIIDDDGEIIAIGLSPETAERMVLAANFIAIESPEPAPAPVEPVVSSSSEAVHVTDGLDKLYGGEIVPSKPTDLLDVPADEAEKPSFRYDYRILTLYDWGRHAVTVFHDGVQKEFDWADELWYFLKNESRNRFQQKWVEAGGDPVKESIAEYLMGGGTIKLNGKIKISPEDERNILASIKLELE